MSVTFYANSIMYYGFDPTAEPTLSGNGYACSGGETSGVVYDLLDNRRTNQVTVDTNGESGTVTIQIDLTSSATCTNMIIDNHNLKTANTDCDIEQGGVDVTLSTSYSGAIGTELSADSINGAFSPDTDGVTLVTFSSVADTQWELLIDEGGVSYAADITIGEIFLSNGFSPSFNPELQPTFGFDMPGSSFSESGGGQRYGFSSHTSKRRSWRLAWRYMSTSDKEDLEDVYLFTGGSKYPFYIDLSGPLGNTNPTLFYVRFMQPLSFRGLTNDAWAVDVYIEEEI